jgi:hypothetical protein
MVNDCAGLLHVYTLICLRPSKIKKNSYEILMCSKSPNSPYNVYLPFSLKEYNKTAIIELTPGLVHTLCSPFPTKSKFKSEHGMSSKIQKYSAVIRRF